MLFEICFLIGLLCFLKYMQVYIDTVLTIHFLKFLRKVVDRLTK
jgi:hypothetical protein